MLAPLGHEHSRALINNLVGAAGLPESVLSQIERRTEGNPFFVEEVVRALIADGTLIEDRRAQGWRLARAMGELTIPGRCSGAQRKAALRAARAAPAKALKCSRTSAAGWQSEAMRLHGTVAWLCGAKPVAMQHWHDSIEIAERMKLPVDQARALLELGDRTNSESHVEEARLLFEQTGAKVDLAFSLHVLARIGVAKGTDAEHALQRYDQALVALGAVKAEYGLAVACRERAQLLVACGRTDEARTDLDRARRGFAAVAANHECVQVEEIAASLH